MLAHRLPPFPSLRRATRLVARAVTSNQQLPPLLEPSLMALLRCHEHRHDKPRCVQGSHIEISIFKITPLACNELMANSGGPFPANILPYLRQGVRVVQGLRVQAVRATLYRSEPAICRHNLCPSSERSASLSATLYSVSSYSNREREPTANSRLV